MRAAGEAPGGAKKLGLEMKGGKGEGKKWGMPHLRRAAEQDGTGDEVPGGRMGQGSWK